MQQSYHVSKRYLFYLMVFLGLISAFGPFVTDMYLPTLPAMAVEFNVSASDIQGGITASLLGLALGQLLFGPLSDKNGRKPILFWSLIIFSMATVMDIYSTSISTFNFFRFFQGVGGAGGIVLSRSIATDCYVEKDLGRTMAIIGAINGIAPILAPVIGGVVAEKYGWQGVFWVLLLIGVSLILLTIPFRESLPQSQRKKENIVNVYRNFILLFHDIRFMKFAFVFALSNVVLFSYISSAPFIIQSLFGLSEKAFSYIFGVNAIAIVLGSTVSVKMPTLKINIFLGSVSIILLSVISLLNSLIWESFWCYEILIWFILFALGLIFPSVTTLAMNQGRIAIGASSAIVGAAGFIAGGIVAPISGLGAILFISSLVILGAGILIIFFLKKLS